MLEDPGRIGESTTPEGPGSRWVTGCLGAVLLLAVLVVGTVVYRHFTDETPATAHLSETQLGVAPLGGRVELGERPSG